MIRPTPSAGRLIGREADLARLVELATPGTVTTIAGPSGIGKTSVAVALMDALADRVADRWMCELASVFTADAIPCAIEDTIGVHRHEDGTSLDALCSALRGRSALLVLDNVEQVVGAASRLCTQLLVRCPDLCIVVTSGEILRAAGEQVHRLAPFGIDGVDGDAKELFTRAAHRSDPAFDPACHDDAIADICRALDGVPLAIELAAAQAATTSVADVSDRLEQRAAAGHEAERGGRPEMLAATVGGSYDLLESSERRLFDRLSVFHGGFDADAVRCVLDADDRDIDVDRVLELLADRSMVVRSAQGSGRYELLDTLRYFGDRQLAESRTRPSVRNAHLQYVVSMVGAASRQCYGPDWRSGLDRFTSEWHNIRSAVNWAIDAQRINEVDRLLSDLYFMCRWTIETEPAAWAKRSIDRGMVTDLPAGAPAYLHIAFLHSITGDHQDALEENRAALAREPAPSDRSWARHYISVALMSRARTTEAGAMADKMVADPPTHPAEHAMQLSAHAVFKLYAQQMHHDDTVAANERAAAMAAETGSPVAIGHVTYNQGLVAFANGDVASARTRFGEALEIGRSERVRNLTTHALVSQVYEPGANGLAAAREAIAHAQTNRDLASEFVILEAAAINLAEIGRLEAAATILGNLDEDRRRLASSKARRDAVSGDIALTRRFTQWHARGADMSRQELLAFAHEAAGEAVETL